jgi:hypothetical protein
MPTHAAISHDLLEKIADVMGQLDDLLAKDAEAQKRLHAEVVRANAVALMKKVASQSRCSESDRQALKAVAEQLGKVA